VVVFGEGVDGGGGFVERGDERAVVVSGGFVEATPEEDIGDGGGGGDELSGGMFGGDAVIELRGGPSFHGEAEGDVESAKGEGGVVDAAASFRLGLPEEDEKEREEHRNREEEVDDEHIVERDAAVAEGFENLGAVGGEDVDEDVGAPGEKDEYSSSCCVEAAFAMKGGKWFGEEEGAEKNEKEGVGDAAVPFELADLVEEAREEDVEVRESAEEESPSSGTPAELAPHDGFANDGAEGGLGDGVHWF